MSIIIEATASRIRPTLRSARARSLLRSTCCSRVKDTAVRVPDCHWPALRPSNKQVNLNAIRWRVCEPLHTCWGTFVWEFFRRGPPTPHGDRLGEKQTFRNAIVMFVGLQL